MQTSARHCWDFSTLVLNYKFLKGYTFIFFFIIFFLPELMYTFQEKEKRKFIKDLFKKKNFIIN